MAIQAAGSILAIIGYFSDVEIIFIIGGFICLLLDIVGFASGNLKLTFPLFLYIGGYMIVGNWHGILWGAIVGNLFDLFISAIKFIPGSKDKDQI